MHCYLISRKEICRQKIFGVMLLFLTLWCFNCPFVSAQQDLLTPSILKDGSTLDISLLNYDSNTLAGKVLDVSAILLPSSSVTVNIGQIPRAIKFIVIQAHSFFYNITLSYKKVLSQNTFVSGTNVGLIQLTTNQENMNAQLFLLNADVSNNVSVLVAVQGYGRDAPIPGGCNMESPVEMAPYLGVGYNDSMVWVDVPPPAPPTPGPKSCERQQAEIEVYHMYLPEGDFSRESYFDALRSMMTVQDVRRNARKVEFALEGPRSRRVFSSYTGTGSVYGVIAIAGFSGAAYVPAITYSCNVTSETNRCDVLNSTFSKFLCAVTLFSGLFVCFFGHRFFKTTLFLLGFLAGGLISYILLALQDVADTTDIMLYSVLVGLGVAIVWSLFWCYCGIPVLTILPGLLTTGYVAAAIAMFAGVADYQIFESDFNYWMLFICIVLSVAILLMSDSRMGNILCCGVLGAYAVIVPIDHYIGSNLKFILLNTIRRATVKHFSMAVLDPPFQKRDTILCFVWFGLAFLGVLVQWGLERGRPPFPSPGGWRNREGRRGRRLPRAATYSDRTPLLTEAPTHYGSSSASFFPQPEDRSFSILPKFPPTAPPAYA